MFDVAILCHSIWPGSRRIGYSSGMAISNCRRHYLAVRPDARGRDRARNIDAPGLCSQKSGGTKYFADRNCNQRHCPFDRVFEKREQRHSGNRLSRPRRKDRSVRSSTTLSSEESDSTPIAVRGGGRRKGLYQRGACDLPVGGQEERREVLEDFFAHGLTPT